jgi:hypothetical protein
MTDDCEVIMRIDVHAHYWTNDYLDMLVELGKTDTDTQRGMGAGGGDDLVARLGLMDRAGVELQVLSAAPQLCSCHSVEASLEGRSGCVRRP